MSTTAVEILVIDDEQPIRRFIKASLENEGYQVIEAASAEDGLRKAANKPPSLIILDLGLPDQDGQEVLKRLREWYTQPILVLSARDQESQKVTALDHGADDYLTKPFGVGELLARMRVAMRHAGRTTVESKKVQFGAIRMDLAARLVFRGDVEVHLTPIEYKLLHTMVQHRGKVLTHRFLLREVWGPHVSHENHYLRVFVATLRRKLEDDPAQPKFLLTEQGVGYRLLGE